MENGVSIYMWSAVEVGRVSTIGVGSGKFFGVRRILPEFSQTCPKRFGRLCLQFFSLKDHEDLFGMISKKGFRVFFCKRWAPFYEMKQSWTPFLPGFSKILRRFSRILPGFSTNQNF